MTVAEPVSGATDDGRREVSVSISARTILLVAGIAAVAWALASIANVLLVILVSLFSVAVLSPVVHDRQHEGGGAPRSAPAEPLLHRDRRALGQP